MISRKSTRRLRYAILRGVFRAGIFIAARIPRRAGLALFGAAGSLAYCFPHEDRNRTLRHLTLIYGNDWDRKRIRSTARGVYRELGKNLFDAFFLTRLPPQRVEKFVTHDSLDNLRKVYDRGNGCIMITAHTGCFEMLLHLFPGYGFKCFAIGRRMHDEGLDRIVRGMRSGDDIVYMDRSEQPRRIVRLLQQGRLFGVLVDQDTSVEGAFADFLGRPAYTPSGPVKMAMKLNVPLFVVTTARKPDNSHHIFVSGPVDLCSGGSDFGRDLVHNVTVVNRMICETIRRYPEQWVWMHERWRRSPSREDIELLKGIG